MYASNRGIRLHWDEQGEGTPVLLVMGHTYTSDMWYPVLPELATRHRVVLFDNRGTGRSGSTRDASMSDLVEDALAVMDAAGLESAHVYGVSMGGFIALQMAMEHPERVRSLVLGCTAMNVDRLARNPAPWLLYRLPNRLLRAVAERKGYGPHCTPEMVARDLDVRFSGKVSRSGLIGQYRAMLGYGYTAEQIADLQIPALVLHGTADEVVPYACGEELAAALPQARLVAYEGAMHNYLIPYGDKANAEVLAHLASLDVTSEVRD